MGTRGAGLRHDEARPERSHMIGSYHAAAKESTIPAPVKGAKRDQARHGDPMHSTG